MLIQLGGLESFASSPSGVWSKAPTVKHFKFEYRAFLCFLTMAAEQRFDQSPVCYVCVMFCLLLSLLLCLCLLRQVSVISFFGVKQDVSFT